MYLIVTVLLCFIVYPSVADVLNPSLNSFVPFDILSKPDSVDCDSSSASVSTTGVYAAAYIRGPVVVDGPIFQLDNNGKYHEHEINGGPFATFCPDDPPSGDDDVDITGHSLDRKYFCTSSHPGDTNCRWFTDWSVWTCNPRVDSSGTGLCVCPMTLTQDPLRPRTIRLVHLRYDKAHSNSIDYAALDINGYGAEVIRRLCRPPDITLNLLSDELINVIEVHCGHSDYNARGRGCMGLSRGLALQDSRLLGEWPRLLGPQWMADAFFMAPMHDDVFHVRFLSRSPVLLSRCSGEAYFYIRKQTDEHGTVLDKWKPSCLPVESNYFHVKPAHKQSPHFMKGVAMDVFTKNGNNILGDAKNTYVCWYGHDLTKCDADGNSIPWRILFYESDGFPIVQPSDDATLPVIRMSMIAF